jgi:Mrp family chromosome partitioning ATPase/capsular polysaccharide biosynthesis protein
MASLLSDRETYDPAPRSSGGHESRGEQPIEMRRHLDALRRARLPILAFVTAVTATVVAVSMLLPNTYKATATIVLEQPLTPFGSTDVQTVQRRLQTIEQLLGTTQVLTGAAGLVPGETRQSLEGAVGSTVDDRANIIRISATDGDPERAAAKANAVAGTFLQAQETAERRRLSEASRQLTQELRNSGARAEEIQAVRARISELTVSEAAVGSELELAQAAEPPASPYSPRPVRNGILALFASLFLAVLVALARDLLVPRAAGARELSRILNLPVLAGIPYVQRRFGRRSHLLTAVANEAYQTLQASVRFELPPDRQRVILVSSALEGEGKTHVAVGLGRALARTGKKTLLVCADLRFPTLHDQFGLARAPGLADILEGIGRNGAGPHERIASALKTLPRSYGRMAENLDILTSGTRPQDASALFFGDALDRFLEAVAELDYAYVIVDGPPLIGIADAHALAQRADGLLVVSRLDRSTLDDAIEVGDLIDRLDVRALGLVVVGVRRNVSYAYAGAPLPAGAAS